MSERLGHIMEAIRRERTDSDALREAYSMMLEDNVTQEEVLEFMGYPWTYMFVTLDFARSFIGMLQQREWIMEMHEALEAWLVNCVHSHQELKPLVMEMVTNNDGYVRFVGRAVWDGMDTSDINLMQQTEDMQLLFGISLLQDFVKPEERLQKVMPLLQSPNPSVRKVISEALALYILNYPGVVREQLDHLEGERTEEMDMIDQSLKNEEERIEYAKECVELRSMYAYPEEHEICWREHNEQQKKIFAAAEERSNRTSFLGLVQNVILGRSGGWRKPDGTYQPLGQISYSAPYPIFLSSQTPVEEWEYTDYMFKNWSQLGAENEQE